MDLYLSLSSLCAWSAMERFSNALKHTLTKDITPNCILTSIANALRNNYIVYFLMKPVFKMIYWTVCKGLYYVRPCIPPLSVCSPLAPPLGNHLLTLLCNQLVESSFSTQTYLTFKRPVVFSGGATSLPAEIRRVWIIYTAINTKYLKLESPNKYNAHSIEVSVNFTIAPKGVCMHAGNQ